MTTFGRISEALQRNAIQAIPTLAGIVVLNFLLLQLALGDQVRRMILPATSLALFYASETDFADSAPADRELLAGIDLAVRHFRPLLVSPEEEARRVAVG